jgi:hypothetical protein
MMPLVSLSSGFAAAAHRPVPGRAAAPGRFAEFAPGLRPRFAAAICGAVAPADFASAALHLSRSAPLERPPLRLEPSAMRAADLLAFGYQSDASVFLAFALG